jgi:DNA (cytosine-5)-methyltransferase 1
LVRAYYNEIDPYCCQVLEKQIRAGNLPEGDVDCRDIREVKGEQLKDYGQVHLFAGIGGIPLGFKWAGMPAGFPIVTGGFPCQDVSKAGNRAGMSEGTRSGLWFEMLRIVRELREKFVLVENVTGLLEWGIGRVLGDLAESGFDAEWDCLPAYTFGAPQPRDRAFILAYPNGERSLYGEAEGHTAEAGIEALRYLRSSCDARILRGPLSDQRRFPEPDIHRVCDGLPSELDKHRIRGLGNAVVPQKAEWIARNLLTSVSEVSDQIHSEQT